MSPDRRAARRCSALRASVGATCRAAARSRCCVLLAVAAAIAADAFAGRRPPAVVREAPTTLSRGVPATLRLHAGR